MKAIKKNRRYRKLIIVLGIIAVLIITSFVVVDKMVAPAVLSIAEARVKSIALRELNRITNDVSESIQYTDLIQVTQDAQGNVMVIQANTIRMNMLASELTDLAQNKISNIDTQNISVPLGTAIGGQLLAGLGPDINVKVIPAGSVSAEFFSQFEEAGINQTRHSIHLQITAQIRLVVSSAYKSVEVTTQVPITETIIVGKVPQSYLNVSELDEALNLWSP
ncbi:MAG: sporulation protein YunB [Christensenellales bacterium]